MTSPSRRRRRVRPPHRRDGRGVSSIELALYMPILLFIIFLAVQFALVFLGNQAAGAVAREAARVARVGGTAQDAETAGQRYGDNIGQGVLDRMTVDVDIVGDQVRVTVEGEAQKLTPVGVPRVRQTVEGPIERFVGGVP